MREFEDSTEVIRQWYDSDRDEPDSIPTGSESSGDSEDQRESNERPPVANELHQPQAKED